MSSQDGKRVIWLIDVPSDRECTGIHISLDTCRYCERILTRAFRSRVTH